jgi:hypothetical protein
MGHCSLMPLGDGRTETTPLLKVNREWPWGLVYLTDFDSREELSSSRIDNSVVLGCCRTTLVSRILHEVDGEAVAEVWLNVTPEGLDCVYDASLSTPSGRLLMGDAVMNESVVTSVAAIEWRAQVYVDNEQHPQRVVVVLSEP